MYISDYLEKFRTQLDVLKSAGGDMCKHPGMVADELKQLGITSPGTTVEAQETVKGAHQRFEAALFMVKSDHHRYGRLVQELANDFNKGHNTNGSI
jgi:hypothetical protein